MDFLISEFSQVAIHKNVETLCVNMPTLNVVTQSKKSLTVVTIDVNFPFVTPLVLV